MIVLVVLAWIGLGLAGLFWLAVLLTTIYRRLTNPYRIGLDSYPDSTVDLGTVSVVIPARNEEDNIEKCVRSVLDQSYPHVEVVVLDDGSTDETPAILERLASADERVQVLSGSELPAGWKGKCWALEQAQAKASGRWLLFLDADVVLAPEALQQALAYVEEHDLEMLSGYGKLVLGSFWEKTIMPVVGGIVVSGNPLDEVNDPDHERAIANGQFILVQRDAYERMGRHETVAAEIIDDVAMARAAKENQVRYHMVFCRELFATRMYTSFSQIWEGWRKNLYAGLHYKPGIAIAVLGFVFYTSIVPYLALAAPAPWRWLAVGIVGLILVNRVYTAILFEHPILYSILHPLGALIVIGIIADSALRGVRGGEVTWKGRSYAAGSAASAGEPEQSAPTGS